MHYTYSKLENPAVMGQLKLYCSIHPVQTQEGVTLTEGPTLLFAFFFSSAHKVIFLFSSTFPSYRLPSSLVKKQTKLS